MECGYSSASLSERIYSGPERAKTIDDVDFMDAAEADTDEADDTDDF